MTVTRSLPAILFIAIFIVIAGSLISTQGRASNAVQTKTINGYLVDVACATDNAKTPTKDFRGIHTKNCMQECAGSGFALLTPDDKILKFDNQSNQLARNFLQGSKKDKDFKVSVTGKLQGDRLSVGSINLKD